MKSNITRILEKGQLGDPTAAEELLPIVYDELRRLAARKLAGEKAGQTLDPTGLVHEAYLRLLPRANGEARHWNGQSHFIAAAAEAMRRILVDAARRKGRLKRGGDRDRVPLDGLADPDIVPNDDLLALDEALNKLASANSQAAELVQLRYFAGLTIPEAAEMMGVSPRTVDRLWTYARAYIHAEMASK